jgi:hypothetical protein
MESRRSRSRWALRSFVAAVEQLRFVSWLSALVLLVPIISIDAIAKGTGGSWAIPVLAITTIPAVYVVLAMVAVPFRPVIGTERAERVVAAAGDRARRLRQARSADH